jgi:hypothetical protein
MGAGAVVGASGREVWRPAFAGFGRGKRGSAFAAHSVA